MHPVIMYYLFLHPISLPTCLAGFSFRPAGVIHALPLLCLLRTGPRKRETDLPPMPGCWDSAVLWDVSGAYWPGSLLLGMRKVLDAADLGVPFSPAPPFAWL